MWRLSQKNEQNGTHPPGAFGDVYNKQRKEEESANPKKEEDEMMKIHKQEALELLKKKEKTKENRQKKKKIADPNKPKKPASSFLLFRSNDAGIASSHGLAIWSKEARKNLLEERPGINDSTLNALISVKWKELSEEDKQTWNEKAAGAKESRWNWKSITNLQ
ncbi:unnamed protein product [Camellia sinensis]